MAASKKLLTEIERGMKKVAEGVEVFEEIWNKIHNSKNLNLKKKYENDLQKEIKKLQRMRDQIKVWLQLGEIKDKTELYNNKRLIETQMERFKIIERETKTKAYSKEGLDAGQKMDPCERIKDDIRNWLTNAIYSLQIQIDLFESEIESLRSSSTTKKSKRVDAEKQERLARSTFRLSRHTWHVERLETILRLLDNDTIGYEPVHKIRDDVQYYIDSSQEPEFAENTYLYEDILNNFEKGESPRSTNSSTDNDLTNNDPVSIDAGTTDVEQKSTTEKQQKIKAEPLESIKELSKPKTPPKPAHLRSHKMSNQLGNAATVVTGSKSASLSDNVCSTSDKPVSSSKFEAWNPEITLNRIINIDDVPSTSKQAQQALHQHYTSSNPDINQQKPTIAEVVASGCVSNLCNENSSNSIPTFTQSQLDLVNKDEPEAETTPVPMPVPVPTTVSSVSGSTTNSPPKREIDSSTPRGLKIKLVDSSPQIRNMTETMTAMTPLNVNSRTTYASVASLKPSNMRNTNKPSLLKYNCAEFKNIPLKTTTDGIKLSKTNTNMEPKVLSKKNSTYLLNEIKEEIEQNANNFNNSDTDEEYFVTDRKTQVGPSVLGDRILKINDPVIPTGSTGYNNTTKWQFDMMNNSYNEYVKFDGFSSPPPEQTDYVPYVVPTTTKHYTGNCFQFWNTTQFYDSLEINSLFFIFYYTNGSMSNYLAAKALKKLRWRFHQGERVWLKRRSDPVVITSDYEKGDYVQFDFDKWIEESRDNFIFEYKYLEEKF